MLHSVRLTISLLTLGSSLLTLGSGALPSLNAANPTDADLARKFSQTVRPFVTSYCVVCHSGPTPAAGFDLQRYTTIESVVEDFDRWSLALRKLSAMEMPPQSMKQPPQALRRQVIDWIAALRKNVAREHAGDPGPVAARRLSNAEYNYTIRDLTGVDLRPAREFPVDPANQAGFDNSGESLTISPSLMSKYLEAARRVGDHLVLKPDGFAFAPHPMLVETDREGGVRMRDFVVKIRRHSEKLGADLEAPGFNANFQPIAVFRLQLLAGNRRGFDASALRVEGEAPQQGFVVTRGPTFGREEAEELKRAIAAYIKERQEDPDLVVPAGARARYEAAFARFCSVFPTAFCLRERGRFYPITSMDKGRFLGAGFHNVMGYFRDDAPLVQLILDENGEKELDALWQEFDFIADYTVRTYYQFIYNAGEGGGLRRNVSDRPSANEFATEAAMFRL